MSAYRLAIPPRVAEQIRGLPPQAKRGIREALRSIRVDPSRGEPLQDELSGYLKYRVRRYRIIYQPRSSDRSIRVMAVEHRRTVYEALAEAIAAERDE